MKRLYDKVNKRYVTNKPWFIDGDTGEVWMDTDPNGVDMSGKRKIKKLKAIKTDQYEVVEEGDVTDPSQLIVEVDGERFENNEMIAVEFIAGELYVSKIVDSFKRYNGKENHIRLITEEGKVVVDKRPENDEQ